MFVRFWERLALRILLESNNVTLLAYKDAALDTVFMSSDRTDPIAWDFFVKNQNYNYEEPDSMMLERLFHSPDSEGE